MSGCHGKGIETLATCCLAPIESISMTVVRSTTLLSQSMGCAQRTTTQRRQLTGSLLISQVDRIIDY
jgi:hypothetical protein